MAGYAEINVNRAITYNFVVVRYQTNGKPDSSFGTNGIAITDLGNYEEAHSMALQTDGKIVVAGFTETLSDGSGKFALVRYNGNSLLTGASNISEIQEQNVPANIYISPNPVKDMLHVEGMSHNIKTIYFLDVKGKLFQTIVTENSNYALHVAAYPSGMYFIRITEWEKTATMKFLKQD